MHGSISNWLLASSLWLVVATPLSAGERAAKPAGPIQIGDAPSYAFRALPVNSLGAQSLADLRDRPVLIEFWGRRCPVCIGAAVPAALKLQESFGDDLAVLFVEAQGSTADEAEAFAIERRWMGGRAMWTTERPFEIRARSLPYFVLLSSEGRALAMGDPLVAHKEIDRRVAEEIARTGDRGVQVKSAARASRSAHHRGRAAEALVELRQLAEGPKSADASAARTALEELSARLERDAERAEWLLENGCFDECKGRIEALRKSLRGDEAWTRRLDELAARLDSPELSGEREAARIVGRAIAQFFHAGGDAASAGELVRLSDAYPTTRAAAEARRLVALVRR